MSYVIKFIGQADTYNLNNGFTVTLEEATKYSTLEEASRKCEDLVDVAGIFKYEDEHIRLHGDKTQSFITREQLTKAIKESMIYSFDKADNTVTSIDPYQLIAEIEKL